IEEPWDRAISPNTTAQISERKAEGKHEGICKDEDSRISPSSSRASQAEVMEEGEKSVALRKEPSVYKDCTESGKTSSSVLSIKEEERMEEVGEAKVKEELIKYKGNNKEEEEEERKFSLINLNQVGIRPLRPMRPRYRRVSKQSEKSNVVEWIGVAKLVADPASEVG
ncbi:hypothetical protein RhiirA5_440444, partial [Rhizophagus irregularis]